MTQALTPESRNSGSIRQAVSDACGRIAPTWPLDRAIAVNPFWEMRDLPFARVAARLEATAQAKCLMPAGYYQSLWGKQIQPQHLTAAADELGFSGDVAALERSLEEVPEGAHWFNVCDWLDASRDREHKMAWRDEVIHQVSQFCAAYFQYEESMSLGAEQDLYSAWLATIRQDRGVEILMGEGGMHRAFLDLPEDMAEVFAAAHELVAGNDSALTAWSHALLLEINGWASWMAYTAWMDAFNEQDNDNREQLLAIMLAWELVLWRHMKETDSAGFAQLEADFSRQLESAGTLEAFYESARKPLWVWHRAAEIAYQAQLCSDLKHPPEAPATPCKLQAAFCIDVRSEPMRRALEAQDDSIQTLGFAGFFGLPIEYQAPGSSMTRPQMPGLLKPTVKAVQAGDDNQMAAGHNASARWLQANEAEPATFGFVEALGLLKAGSLIKRSLFPSDPEHAVNRHCGSGHWDLIQDGAPMSAADKAGMAKSVLGAMGLVRDFAPTIILFGHGSATTNNPFAAALDCGACNGQTGEVNVKVLADILNDEAVRSELAALGTEIPAETRFYAGLHNTTTDELVNYGEAPPSEVQAWLRGATDAAQRKRAAAFAMDDSDGASAEYRRRSRDWGQLRPEWGLANNAAFVVAPRSRTRHLDLAGRSFLHDYRWQDDEGFGVLELIMTAPMVVTNWINMQYYASVTDNLKYGSGNKLLHNVVGGNIGVFEGNGGDLRIGLPMQSLHDGSDWRHQPLRLNVFIQAPKEAIAEVASNHEVVRQLIDNDWLYLFQLDDEGQEVSRFYSGEWLPSPAQ